MSAAKELVSRFDFVQVPIDLDELLVKSKLLNPTFMQKFVSLAQKLTKFSGLPAHDFKTVS